MIGHETAQDVESVSERHLNARVGIVDDEAIGAMSLVLKFLLNFGIKLTNSSATATPQCADFSDSGQHTF